MKLTTEQFEALENYIEAICQEAVGDEIDVTMRARSKAYDLLVGEPVVSVEICLDMRDTIHANLDSWKNLLDNLLEVDSLKATFSLSEKGDSWGYQIGEATFPRSSFYHVAITTITPDTTEQQLYDEVINRWEACIKQ